MVALTIDEEFIRKCEQAYEKNRASLESRYDGKIVALYEDGVAAIGETTDSVYREASRKHPDKIFYVRRIGKYSASGYVF